MNSSNLSAQNASSAVGMPNSPSTDVLQFLDGTIWMNALRLVIAVNTIGTNAFLLCLFLRFRQLRNNQCNRLIFLNSIMDTITGFGPLVRGIFQLYIMNVYVEQFTKMVCILISLPYTLGYAGSQITFIGLALDRLFAVIMPLTYKRKEQKKLTIIIGALALLFMLLLYATKIIGVDLSVPSKQCSTPLNSGPWFSTFWTVFINTSTLIVFVTYILVIVFFIRNTSSEAIAPNISQYQAHVRAKDRQLTITVALILLNYTVSWTLPSAVWAMFILMDPSKSTRLNYMSYIQGYMGAAGCGFNLYIYLYKHAEIRRCSRAFFSKGGKVEPMWSIQVQPSNPMNNTIRTN